MLLSQTISEVYTYLGTIGGTVHISTTDNRAPPPPRLTSLHHQQQQTLSRHLRKMAYEEQYEATSLYITYIVYMVITQTKYTVALLLAVILEERRHRPSTSSSWPQGKNLEPAQNTKSKSNLIERIHAQVMQLSKEKSRCFYMRNPIRFSWVSRKQTDYQRQDSGTAFLPSFIFS